MTSRLIVADTHFTNKPADEYRWLLFPYLKKWVLKYEVDELWILGDITDAKEGHDAKFVNRLVDGLVELAKHTAVYLLRGNHDYLLKECAFFEFLRNIPNIYWIDRPTVVCEVLALPHSKDPKNDWASLLNNLDEYPFVFFHQCFLGSKSSLGHILEGTDLDLTSLDQTVALAGDIHMPQTVRGIEYVGSPYPTTYGDRFLGRCLLYRDDKERLQLHLPTIQKCTLVISEVSELYEARIYPDDQIKVRYNLTKEQRSNWTNIKQEIRNACDDLGVYLGGIELVSDEESKGKVREAVVRIRKTSDKDVLKRFAATRDLPDDYLSVAEEIMGES